MKRIGDALSASPKSPFPSTRSDPTRAQRNVALMVSRADQSLDRRPGTDQDSSMFSATRVLSPACRPFHARSVLPILTLKIEEVSARSTTE